MAANAKGQELKATAGDSSNSLKDILIGEVWLASGQSNMGFSIPKSTHAEEARKLIPHPTLRRFKVGSYIATNPIADIGEEGAFQHPHWRMGDVGKWRTVDNERHGLNWISAVAAWFGHEVRISQGVPVGIIESHFGGSKLYCWMPRESLENSPEFTRDIIEPIGIKKKGRCLRCLATRSKSRSQATADRTMEALLSLQCYDCTDNAVRDARRDLVSGRIQPGARRSLSKTTPRDGKRLA